MGRDSRRAGWGGIGCGRGQVANCHILGRPRISQYATRPLRDVLPARRGLEAKLLEDLRQDPLLILVRGQQTPDLQRP